MTNTDSVESNGIFGATMNQDLIPFSQGRLYSNCINEDRASTNTWAAGNKPRIIQEA